MVITSDAPEVCSGCLVSIEEDDLVTAQNLVMLTVGATVGEMTCLEEIVKTLLLQEKIPSKVVKALILIALDRDTMPHCCSKSS